MITSSAHATATAVGSATWSDNSQENTVHNGCTCFSPSLTASPCSLDTSGTACPPTLVYEDLGAGNAYQPAFLLPN